MQIDVTKADQAGAQRDLGRHPRRLVWILGQPDDPMKLRRTWNVPKKFFGDGFQDLAYPIWNHPESGILATPVLFAAGPAYVADVFVKPSVREEELAVESP